MLLFNRRQKQLWSLFQAAATSGAHVSATILPKSCTASQSPTVMPASGGIFTLVANSKSTIYEC